MNNKIKLENGRTAIDFCPEESKGVVAIVPLNVAKSMVKQLRTATFSEAKKAIVSRLLDCQEKDELVDVMLGFINFDSIINAINDYAPQEEADLAH